MFNYVALQIGVIFCFLVRGLYYVVDVILAGRNDFYNALPNDKKMYVQKNLVKSFILACILPFASVTIIYPIWHFNIWYTEYIHIFAVLYGANDFVGLICVDNLPKTTRVHHIISTTLVITALTLDFKTSEVGQSMLVYTFFAASAYSVNFHLAARWLFKRGQKRWLRYGTGIVYTICCVMSWLWQIRWMYNTQLHWYHVVYIWLMLWIVRDDIILMRWLTSI
jgi:hypothetical protein